MNSVYYFFLFIISSATIVSVPSNNENSILSAEEDLGPIYITAAPADDVEGTRLIDIEFAKPSMQETTIFSIYDQENRQVVLRNAEKVIRTTHTPQEDNAGFYNSQEETLDANTLSFRLNSTEAYTIYVKAGTKTDKLTIDAESFWNYIEGDAESCCPSAVIYEYSDAVQVSEVYFQEVGDITLYKDAFGNWKIHYKNNSINNAVEAYYSEGSNITATVLTSGYYRRSTDLELDYFCNENEYMPESGAQPIGLGSGDGTVNFIMKPKSEFVSVENEEETVSVTQDFYTVMVLENQEDPVHFIKYSKEGDEEFPADIIQDYPILDVLTDDPKLYLRSEGKEIRLDYPESYLTNHFLLTIYDDQDRMVLYRQPGIYDEDGTLTNDPKFITFDYAAGGEVYTDTRNELVSFFGLNSGNHTLYALNLETENKASYQITADFIDSECDAHWIEDFNEDIPLFRFEDPEEVIDIASILGEEDENQSSDEENQNLAGEFALEFDGAEGFLDLGEGDLSTNALTLATWLKPNSYSETQFLVGTRNQAELRLKNGIPNILLKTSSGILLLDAKQPLPIGHGKWFHLAGTYDGSRVALYLNGELLAEKIHNGQIETKADSRITVGGRYEGDSGGNNDGFNGKMDETTIWRDDLTQEEIQEMIDLGVDKEDNDLIAYLDYSQGGSNAIVKDVSNHGLDGNFNGLDITTAWVNNSARPRYPMSVSGDRVLNLSNKERHIVVEQTRSLDLGGNFTFEFWGKSDFEGNSVSPSSAVFEIPAIWGVNLQDGRDLIVSTSGTNTDFRNGFINDNRWHHYAFTLSAGNSLSFYRDGFLIEEKTGSYTTEESGEDFYIGSLGDDSPILKLDDLSIWNDVRDEAEIFSDYMSQRIDLEDEQLVMHFNFNYTHGQWLLFDQANQRRLGVLKVGGNGSAPPGSGHEVYMDPRLPSESELADKPESKDIDLALSPFFLENDGADGVSLLTLSSEDIFELQLISDDGQGGNRIDWWTREGDYYMHLLEDKTFDCFDGFEDLFNLLPDRFDGSYQAIIGTTDGQIYELNNEGVGLSAFTLASPGVVNDFSRSAKKAKLGTREGAEGIDVFFRGLGTLANAQLSVFDEQDRLIYYHNPQEAVLFDYDEQFNNYQPINRLSNESDRVSIPFDFSSGETYYLYLKQEGGDESSAYRYHFDGEVDKQECFNIGWILESTPVVNEPERFSNPLQPVPKSTVDYALNLEESDQYVYIKDADDLTLPTDFTVEFWVKSDYIGNYGTAKYILGQEGSWKIYTEKDRLIFSTNEGLITYHFEFEADGEWHHYAFSCSSGNAIELIKDGVIRTLRVEQSTAYGIQDSEAPLIIGHPSAGLEMEIDDIAIFNYAKDYEQIQEDFLSGISRSAAGLILFYDFSYESDTWLIHDQSGNEHTGVLQRINYYDVWVSSSKPEYDFPHFEYCNFELEDTEQGLIVNTNNESKKIIELSISWSNAGDTPDKTYYWNDDNTHYQLIDGEFELFCDEMPAVGEVLMNEEFTVLEAHIKYWKDGAFIRQKLSMEDHRPYFSFGNDEFDLPEDFIIDKRISIAASEDHTGLDCYLPILPLSTWKERSKIAIFNNDKQRLESWWTPDKNLNFDFTAELGNAIFETSEHEIAHAVRLPFNADIATSYTIFIEVEPWAGLGLGNMYGGNAQVEFTGQKIEDACNVVHWLYPDPEFTTTPPWFSDPEEPLTGHTDYTLGLAPQEGIILEEFELPASYTVQAWVKLGDFSSTSAFMTWGNTEDETSFHKLSFPKNNQETIVWESSVTQPDRIDAAYDFGTDWHHIAITKDAYGDGKIYVDGELLKTQRILNAPNTNYIQIGGSGFQGSIDDLAISSGARTKAQIQVDYVSGFDPVANADNLLAFYNFNEGTGEWLIRDHSDNRYTGMLQIQDATTAWAASDIPPSLDIIAISAPYGVIANPDGGLTFYTEEALESIEELAIEYVVNNGNSQILWWSGTGQHYQGASNLLCQNMVNSREEVLNSSVTSYKVLLKDDNGVYHYAASSNGMTTSNLEMTSEPSEIDMMNSIRLGKLSGENPETGLNFEFYGNLTMSHFEAGVYDITNERIIAYRSPIVNLFINYGADGFVQSIDENEMLADRFEMPLTLNSNNEYQLFFRLADESMGSWDFVQSDLTSDCEPNHWKWISEFDEGTAPDWFRNPKAKGDTNHAIALNGEGRVELKHFECPDNFTVEAWIMLEENMGGDILKWHNTNSPENAIIKIQWDPINFRWNIIYSQYIAGSGEAERAEGNASNRSFTPGEWHHLAVSRSTNGRVWIYLNGQRVGGGDVQGSFSSSSNLLQVGPYRSNIDELSIWSVEKSLQDIEADITGFEATAPNLEAYYLFDEGAGAFLINDYTSNERYGTLKGINYNTAWIASDREAINLNTITSDFALVAQENIGVNFIKQSPVDIQNFYFISSATPHYSSPMRRWIGLDDDSNRCECHHNVGFGIRDMPSNGTNLISYVNEYYTAYLETSDGRYYKAEKFNSAVTEFLELAEKPEVFRSNRVRFRKNDTDLEFLFDNTHVMNTATIGIYDRTQDHLVAYGTSSDLTLWDLDASTNPYSNLTLNANGDGFSIPLDLTDDGANYEFCLVLEDGTFNVWSSENASVDCQGAYWLCYYNSDSEELPEWFVDPKAVVAGATNHSIHLTDETTKLKLVPAEALNLDNDFSIDFWIKRQSGGIKILRQDQVALKLSDDFSSDFFRLLTSNQQTNYQTNILDEGSEWHHYAITGTYGSSLNIYQDAELIGQYSENYSAIGSNSTAGISLEVEGSEIEIELDELRFWGRQLSHDEIRDYFFKNTNNSLVDLIAYYSFDEGIQTANPNILIDHTGQGHFGIHQNNLGRIVSTLPNSPNFNFCDGCGLLVQSTPTGDLILYQERDVDYDIESICLIQGEDFKYWTPDGLLIEKIGEADPVIRCEAIPDIGSVLINETGKETDIGISFTGTIPYTLYVHGQMRTTPGMATFGKSVNNTFFSSLQAALNYITFEESGNGYNPVLVSESVTTDELDLSLQRHFKTIALKKGTTNYIIPYDENGSAGLPTIVSTFAEGIEDLSSTEIFVRNTTANVDYGEFAFQDLLSSTDCPETLLTGTIQIYNDLLFELKGCYKAYLELQADNTYEMPYAKIQSLGTIKEALCIYPNNQKYFIQDQSLLYQTNNDQMEVLQTFDNSQWGSNLESAYLKVERDGATFYYELANITQPYFVVISEAAYAAVAKPDVSWIFAVQQADNGNYNLIGPSEDIESLYLSRTDGSEEYYLPEQNLVYEMNTKLACGAIPSDLGDDVFNIEIVTKAKQNQPSRFLMTTGMNTHFLSVTETSGIEDFEMPPYLSIQSLEEWNVNNPSSINTPFGPKRVGILEIPATPLLEELTISMWEIRNETERQVSFREPDGRIKIINYYGDIPSPPGIQIWGNDFAVPVPESANVIYIRHDTGGEIKDYRFEFDSDRLEEGCYYLPVDDGNTAVISDDKVTLQETVYEYTLAHTPEEPNSQRLFGNFENIDELFLLSEGGITHYHSNTEGFYYDVKANALTCEALPNQFDRTVHEEIWVKTTDGNYYGCTDLTVPYLINQSAPAAIQNFEQPDYFKLNSTSSNLTFEFPIAQLAGELEMAIWETDVTYGDRMLASRKTDGTIEFVDYYLDQVGPIQRHENNDEYVWPNYESKDLYVRHTAADGTINDYYFPIGNSTGGLDCANLLLASPITQDDSRFALPNNTYAYSTERVDSERTIVGDLTALKGMYINKEDGSATYYDKTAEIAYDISNNLITCEDMPTAISTGISEVWLKSNDGTTYGLNNLDYKYFTTQSTSLFDDLPLMGYIRIQQVAGSDNELQLVFSSSMTSANLKMAVWEEQSNGSERIVAHRENDVLNTITYNIDLPAPPVTSDAPNIINLNNLENKRIYINYTPDGESYYDFLFLLEDIEYTGDCAYLPLSVNHTNTVVASKFVLPTIEYAFGIERVDDLTKLRGTIEDISELYVKYTDGSGKYFNESFGVSYNLETEEMICETIVGGLGANIREIWLKTTNADGTITDYAITNLNQLYLTPRNSSEIDDLTIPNFIVVSTPTAPETGLDLAFSDASLSQEAILAVWETLADGAERMLSIRDNTQVHTYSYNASGLPNAPQNFASSGNIPFSDVAGKQLYIQRSTANSIMRYQFDLASLNLNTGCQVLVLETPDNAIAAEKFDVPFTDYVYSIDPESNTNTLFGTADNVDELWIERSTGTAFYSSGSENFVFDGTNYSINCSAIPTDLGTDVTSAWIKTKGTSSTPAKFFQLSSLDAQYFIENTVDNYPTISIPDFIELNNPASPNTGMDLAFSNAISQENITMSIWNDTQMEAIWEEGEFSVYSYNSAGLAEDPTITTTNSNLPFASTTGKTLYVRYDDGTTTKDYQINMENIDLASGCQYIVFNTSDSDFTMYFERPFSDYAYAIDLSSANNGLIGTIENIDELWIERSAGQTAFYRADSENILFDGTNYSINCNDMLSELGSDLTAVWIKTQDTEPKYYRITDINSQYFIEASASDYPGISIPDFIELNNPVSPGTGMDLAFSNAISQSNVSLAIWNGDQLETNWVGGTIKTYTYNSAGFPNPPAITNDSNNLPFSSVAGKTLYVRYDDGSSVKDYEISVDNIDLTNGCQYIIFNTTVDDFSSKFELPFTDYAYSVDLENNTLIGTIDNIDELWIERSTGTAFYSSTSENIFFDGSSYSINCEAIPSELGDDAVSAWIKTISEAETTSYYQLSNLNEQYFIEQEASDYPTITVPNFMQFSTASSPGTGLDLTFSNAGLAANIQMAIWEGSSKLHTLWNNGSIHAVSYDANDIPSSPVTTTSETNLPFSNGNQLYIRYEDGDEINDYEITLANLNVANDCAYIVLNESADNFEDKFDLSSMFQYTLVENNGNWSLTGDDSNIEELYLVDNASGNQYYKKYDSGTIRYQTSSGGYDCVAFPFDALAQSSTSVWLKSNDNGTVKYYGVDDFDQPYFTERNLSDLPAFSWPSLIQLDASANDRVDLTFLDSGLEDQLTLALWLENSTPKLLTLRTSEELKEVTYADHIPNEPTSKSNLNQIDLRNPNKKVFYIKNNSDGKTYQFNLDSEKVTEACYILPLEQGAEVTDIENKFDLEANTSHQYYVRKAGNKNHLHGDDSIIEELYIVRNNNNIHYYQKSGNTYHFIQTNNNKTNCRNLPSHLGNTVNEVWVKVNENGTEKYYGTTDIDLGYMILKQATDLAHVQIPELMELSKSGGDGIATLNLDLSFLTEGISTDANLQMALWEEPSEGTAKLLALRSNSELVMVPYINNIPQTPISNTSNLNNFNLSGMDGLENKYLYIKRDDNSTYKIALAKNKLDDNCYVVTLGGNTATVAEEKFDIGGLFAYAVNADNNLIGNMEVIEEMYLIKNDNSTELYVVSDEISYAFDGSDYSINCNFLPTIIGDDVTQAWIKTATDAENEERYYQITNLANTYFLEQQAENYPSITLPDFIQVSQASTPNTGLNLNFSDTDISGNITMAIWEGTDQLRTLWEGGSINSVSYNDDGFAYAPVQSANVNLLPYTIANSTGNILFVRHDDGTTTKDYSVDLSTLSSNCEYIVFNNSANDFSDKFDLASMYPYVVDNENNLLGDLTNIDQLYVIGSDDKLTYYGMTNGVKYDESNNSMICNTQIPTEIATNVNDIWILTTEGNHFGLEGLTGQYLGVKTSSDFADFTIPIYIRYAKVTGTNEISYDLYRENGNFSLTDDELSFAIWESDANGERMLALQEERKLQTIAYTNGYPQTPVAQSVRFYGPGSNNDPRQISFSNLNNKIFYIDNDGQHYQVGIPVELAEDNCHFALLSEDNKIANDPGRFDIEAIFPYSLEPLSSLNSSTGQMDVVSYVLEPMTNVKEVYVKHSDNSTDWSVFNSEEAYLYHNQTNTAECTFDYNFATDANEIWVKNAEDKIYRINDLSAGFFVEQNAADYPTLIIPKLIKYEVSEGSNTTYLEFLEDILADGTSFAISNTNHTVLHGQGNTITSASYSSVVGTLASSLTVEAGTTILPILEDIIDNVTYKLYIKLADGKKYKFSIQDLLAAESCEQYFVLHQEDNTIPDTYFDLPQVMATGTAPFNTALNFANTTDYLISDYPGITSVGTFEAWLKPTVNDVLIASWGGLGTNAGITVKINSQGKLVVNDITFDITVCCNEWYHLAVTISDHSGIKKINAFLDGVKAETNDVNDFPSLPIATDGKLRLGVPINGSTQHIFQGEMDEVRLWNVRRSTTELIENRGKELMGTEADLALYYKFNTNTSVFADGAGTDNAGHLIAFEDYNISQSGSNYSLNGNLTVIETLIIEHENGDITHYDNVGSVYSSNDGTINCYNSIPSNLGTAISKVWIDLGGQNNIYGTDDLSNPYFKKQTTLPSVTIPEFLRFQPVTNSAQYNWDFNGSNPGSLKFSIWNSADDQILALRENGIIQIVDYAGFQPAITPGVQNAATIDLADLADRVIYIERANGSRVKFTLPATADDHSCYHAVFVGDDPNIADEKFELPSVIAPGTAPFNASLDLSSGTNYIETNYDGITGKNDRTIETWIKTSNEGTILSWGKTGSNGKNWKVAVEPTGELSVRVKGGYRIGTEKVNDNEWHHIAIVLVDDGSPNANELVFYIDGELETYSDTDGQAINTATGGFLELGSFNGEEVFSGLIDELRIWSVARSQGDISSTMGYELLGSEIGLELYYNFNSGTDPQDVSGNNRNGTFIAPVAAYEVETTGNTSTLLGDLMIIKRVFYENNAGELYYYNLTNGFFFDEVNGTMICESFAGEIGNDVAKVWLKTADKFYRITDLSTQTLEEVNSGAMPSTPVEDFVKFSEATAGGFDLSFSDNNLSDNLTLALWNKNDDKLLAYRENEELKLVNYSGGSAISIDVQSDPNLFDIPNLNDKHLYIKKPNGKKYKVTLLAGGTAGCFFAPVKTDDANISDDKFVLPTVGISLPIAGGFSNSSDNYIATSWKGITEDKSRSFEAWVKTSSSNKVIAEWGTGGNGKRWKVMVNNNGELRIAVNGGTRIGTSKINDGTWHHIAVVLEKDNNTNVNDVKLYVDGELENNSSTSGRPINTSDAGVVSIGAANNGGSILKGEIDEVRIWSKALNKNQIQNNMNQELTGTETDLALYFNFNGSSNPQDISGNNRNGVLYPLPDYEIETTGNSSDLVGNLTIVKQLFYEKNNGKLYYYNLTDGFFYKDDNGAMECNTFSGTIGSNIAKVWVKTDDGNGAKYYQITDLSVGGMEEIDVSVMPANPVEDFVKLSDAATPGYNLNFSSTDLENDLTLALWNKDEDELLAYRENGELKLITYSEGIPSSIDVQSDPNLLNIDDLKDRHLYIQDSNGDKYKVTLKEGTIADCFFAAVKNADTNISDDKFDLPFIPPAGGGFSNTSANYISTNWKGIGGKGSRTFEAWVKPTNKNKTLVYWGGAGNGNKWQILIDDAGRLKLHVNGGWRTGTTDIRDGDWHHVAVVLNNDGSPTTKEVKLYVDGQEETYSNTKNRAINTKKITLLCVNATPVAGSILKGELDEVRIWSKALSQSEIQAKMNKELTGTETDLELYFNFNNVSGASVPDESPNGRDGTIN